MAGDWIPIDHDFPEKAEVLAIHQQTGVSIAEIMLAMHRLWRTADRQTIDGVLRDIGVTACVTLCGQNCDFWRAVQRVGWLGVADDGSVFIPDFARRFGQSARVRLLAARRKRRQRTSDRDGLRDTSVTDCVTKTGQKADETRSPVSVSVSVPISEPVPEPEPEDGSAAQNSVGLATDVRAVFDHYRKYHPRAHPKPQSSSKEWKAVAARLKAGNTVDDLCTAIDGCHVTPHNLGVNERDTKYLGLELICRTGDQVSRFIEAARDPPKPRNERERRTLSAAQAWLDRKIRNEPS